MAEGALDPAPIWSDVSTFDGRRWAGAVDLIVAGFPCQPHSVAGKREGITDARWPVWEDIIRIAKECSARSVFLENVPGLLTSSGGASIARVRADLEHAGFKDQRACVLAAADVGASHRRQRLFILANRDDIGQQWRGGAWGWRGGPAGKGGSMAHANGQRQSQRGWDVSNVRRWSGDESASMADASGPRLEGRQEQPATSQRQAAERGGYSIFAPGPDANWSAVDPALWPATAQPAIRGVADGTARRMDISRGDRLRMLGNGVVPLQAAAALTHLIDGWRD
jgi:DNA (cytosine-5)-methyltransferase 1